ncbi:MAG TPA: hydrolase [Solibacterales bacterium]|nr:hydrolase [Bryobacterales bacterium]
MPLRCAVLFLLLLAPLPGQGWQLVWSDEFNGPANSLPDTAKWGYDLGGGGFGNAELETYTNSPGNIWMDGNGNLVIHALRPAAGVYTSARIKTQDKFSIAYGKIEARIKIPYGQGIWPAFWMLGAHIKTVGWPACGEIDIMENIGKEPTLIHGTVHGPGYSGGNGIGKAYALPSGQPFANDFHVFTVVWSPNSVEFQVDGNAYFTVTPQSLPSGAKWVYNTPFFLLLNLAVGGAWPGYPDATTTFPQVMTIDYVRVYRSTTH